MSDEDDDRPAATPWMSERIRSLADLGRRLDRSIEDAAELRKASEEALRVAHDLDRLQSVQSHRYPGVVVRSPDTMRAGDPLVLVGDPDPAAYVDGLLADGYRLAVMSDGVQVVDAALHLRPTVVILNLSSPRVDGLEATRRLRRRPLTTHVPIIALVSPRDRELAAQARDMGCDRCCPATAPPDVLLGHILEALILRRRRSAARKAALRGQRVLVVDDDADMLEIALETMYAEGAHPVTTPTAAEAIALLHRERYALVVCDIRLPDVSGHNVIRQLRAFPPEAGGQTPAAAMTAYPTVQDRRTARAAGFDLYLEKPLRLDWVDAVAGLLGPIAAVSL